MSYNEFCENIEISYDKDIEPLFKTSIRKWIEDVRNESIIGDTFNINPKYLKPYSEGEYIEMSDGNGITNGPVEICFVNSSIYIVDGHHRVYEALKNKKKSIKVVIVEPLTRKPDAE